MTNSVSISDWRRTEGGFIEYAVECLDASGRVQSTQWRRFRQFEELSRSLKSEGFRPLSLPSKHVFGGPDLKRRQQGLQRALREHLAQCSGLSGPLRDWLSDGAGSAASTRDVPLTPSSQTTTGSLFSSGTVPPLPVLTGATLSRQVSADLPSQEQVSEQASEPPHLQERPVNNRGFLARLSSFSPEAVTEHRLLSVALMLLLVACLLPGPMCIDVRTLLLGSVPGLFLGARLLVPSSLAHEEVKAPQQQIGASVSTAASPRCLKPEATLPKALIVEVERSFRLLELNLRRSENEDGIPWEPKSSSKDIEIWSSALSGNKKRRLWKSRIEVTMTCSYDTFQDHLNDWNKRLQWDKKTLADGCTIQSFGDGTDLIRYVTSPQAGGAVSSREFCDLRGMREQLNPEGEGFLMTFLSISPDQLSCVPPKGPNNVRGRVYAGSGMFARPLGPASTEGTRWELFIVDNRDLGGWLPVSLVTAAMSSAMMSTCRTFRDYLSKLESDGAEAAPRDSWGLEQVCRSAVAATSDPPTASNDSDLEARFHQAVAAANTWAASRTSKADKLNLYKWFKQATVGDNPEARAPGIHKLKERAKWEAWRSATGTSKDEAMKMYIEEFASQRAKYGD
eukprot:TRINITY_DN5341_c0_g1_i1.p1 TRINITY_DN5341_c0_g1~~TRINITY_DN5341_c0_g1_i1.p1  ORF type:complete len:622 (+),score=112.46 TRINITY_DN5341_c0_g1_i1:85-1950(+)